MMNTAYSSPIVTVDCVVFQLIHQKLAVLLIARINQPFAGIHALPGGYVNAGETTLNAMTRIVDAKAGIILDQCGVVEQLYTFDTVARDPRGYAISVTYMALSRSITPELRNDTHHPNFFPIDALPEIAFDHAQIIEYALERLKSKISYTNAIYALLPELFTLSQLQTAYEAVVLHPLDKRNFRKKILGLGIIHETAQTFREGAHRPARLFRFNKDVLTNINEF
ncbi:MAG: NUDIX domain-containing protein [Chloroflexales bacterium]|nr:NUDIX domain-containing protein [Chloroflexales bacterium]